MHPNIGAPQPALNVQLVQPYHCVSGAMIGKFSHCKEDTSLLFLHVYYRFDGVVHSALGSLFVWEVAKHLFIKQDENEDCGW